MTDQPEFVTGESDPADYGVEAVAAHLLTASPDEFSRVIDLETGEGGKGRKGITSLTLPDPTEVPQETNDDGQPVGVLGLAVGDEYDTDDGRPARVVSIDGT